MSDEVLYELGVDIHSSCTFINGDLALSSYTDNLIQAIINRLQTQLNELDWFYQDYGSILTDFLGWKANDETLQYMRAEINTVLSEEIRLDSYSCELEYTGEGTVRMQLILYPTPATNIPVNLVLGRTGTIELEVDTDLTETMEET